MKKEVIFMIVTKDTLIGDLLANICEKIPKSKVGVLNL